jgi:hypothetical protein
VVHKRLSIALAVTLCPVAGWTAGAWHASTSDRIRPVYGAALPVATPEPPAAGWSALPDPAIEEPPNDDRLDLYGNDVSPAIARYTHDSAGAVREEHSPATEVTRLAPPTT